MRKKVHSILPGAIVLAVAAMLARPAHPVNLLDQLVESQGLDKFIRKTSSYAQVGT